MLDGFERWALFYDLALMPFPPTATGFELEPFADALIDRAEAGQSVRQLEGGRRTLRITKARRVQLRDGTPGLALLFTLADPRGADPGFQHMQTGVTRSARKQAGEGKAVSVHSLIRLTRSVPDMAIYPMISEEVVGLGRSMIQDMLKAEFRVIAEDLGYETTLPSGTVTKARPVPEIVGRRSEELGAAITGGILHQVELIDPRVVSQGVDEPAGIELRRRQLSVRIRSFDGSVRDKLNELKNWAHSQGYPEMHVRWRVPNTTRTQGTTLPTALQDVGEALYVKRRSITVDRALDECSESIRDDLLAALVGIFE